ncbi:VOC family protein [Sabulicella rubraurantiaca]|uniref:VOC family protein n=1 Tax=Sabulicella rubraurantiaca TaxID=2811429 RepID=UPI001A95BD75|nr:VOC family protein [Sabulicella rubraurantiaca]
MSGSNQHLDPSFDLNAAPMRIGRVRLRVRDLSGVVQFYRDILGLVPVKQSNRRAVLGAGAQPLMELIGDPRFAALEGRQAGLFHTAFILPDRTSLGRWLRFAKERNIGLDGAADHGVSEAVYLADPEGNGIEIYSDRPVSAWHRTGRKVEMTNDRLDLEELMRVADGPWTGMPTESTIGHVHLQVGDIAEAEHFYGDLLGFEVTCRFPQASFFGAGGYHHQLAANTWRSGGAGPRMEGMAGLDAVELMIRNGADGSAVEARARAAGMTVKAESGERMLCDPWGTVIIVAPG